MQTSLWDKQLFLFVGSILQGGAFQNVINHLQCEAVQSICASSKLHYLISTYFAAHVDQIQMDYNFILKFD